MKLDANLLDQIEKADAIYIIGALGEKHFTSVQGVYDDDLSTIHHLVQSMLGSINTDIRKEPRKMGNSAPLLVLLSVVLKHFPELERTVLKQ